MSINFSANQYEQTFHSKRIQNWQVPKEIGKYPRSREGFSTFHANDRGHLLPNVPRRRESPWGTFVGTWDLPLKIPGNNQFNTTARSEDAQIKLQTHKMEAYETLSGGLKKCRMRSPQPVRIVNEDQPTNRVLVQPPEPILDATLAAPESLTPPVLPMTHEVIWPKHGYDRDKHVGNAGSQKPLTPMPVAGEGVQASACQMVSPVDPDQVARNGAVATPIEPVTGQLRTPVADVNWPIAKSTEPPVQ